VARILPYDTIRALDMSPNQVSGLDLARNELERLHAEGDILGGMLYGSQVVNDALPTSDLDQITVVENRTTAVLQKIRNAGMTVLKGSGTFVENVTYTRGELSSGNHRLIQACSRI
jgi:hypothetical protein